MTILGETNTAALAVIGEIIKRFCSSIKATIA
jgi:hypothetical protein